MQAETPFYMRRASREIGVWAHELAQLEQGCILIENPQHFRPSNRCLSICPYRSINSQPEANLILLPVACSITWVNHCMCMDACTFRSSSKQTNHHPPRNLKSIRCVLIKLSLQQRSAVGLWAGDAGHPINQEFGTLWKPRLDYQSTFALFDWRPDAKNASLCGQHHLLWGVSDHLLLISP